MWLSKSTHTVNIERDADLQHVGEQRTQQRAQ